MPHHLPLAALHRVFGSLKQLLAVMLLCSVLPALALEDFVTQRGYLADDAAHFTIEDVISKTFTPVAGPLSRGYTRSVTWLRLEVAPTSLETLALVVQTAYLDDLRLYSPTADGTSWTVQQAGDRFLQATRSSWSVNPSFLIHSDRNAPTVHYLRLQTTSASLVHAKAMPVSDAMTFDTLLHATIGGYIGLIVVLMAFALICWRLTRDKLWVFDAMLQFTTVAFTFFNMGFAGKYLLANHPLAADAGVSVATCVQVATASLFFWQLFKAYDAPAWTTLLYRMSLVMLPVFLVLIALGAPQTAVKSNANLLLLQTFLGTVIVWFVKIEDPLQRQLVRFTYVALVIYLMFYALPLVGLTPASEFNLYPALLGNLFTSVMLQVVLARRTQLQLRERWKLRLAMAEADEKLKSESERREAATTFLGMLMHEIKNPLTSIRAATESLVSGRFPDPTTQMSRLKNIQKSVESIDTVLERCVEADRMEQGVLRIQRAPCDIAHLLTQWVAAEKQHSRLQLQAPLSLPAVVDSQLLNMMVRNLLSNALTYSPADSSVQVTLYGSPANNSRAEGYAIQVFNMAGIAGAPDPALVFSKYYRAPMANRVSGTGLGLYWVHNVASLLGGLVTCTSESSPAGTRIAFTLWLPKQ